MSSFRVTARKRLREKLIKALITAFIGSAVFSFSGRNWSFEKPASYARSGDYQKESMHAALLSKVRSQKRIHVIIGLVAGFVPVGED